MLVFKVPLNSKFVQKKGNAGVRFISCSEKAGVVTLSILTGSRVLNIVSANARKV